MAGAVCSVPGCGRPVLNIRGWCNRHYLRWRRHGDPLAGRSTPHGALKQEMERALAEANIKDCWVWEYTLNATGYPQLVLDGRTRRVNRVVCIRAHGAPPTPAHQAAHSCGNRKCINPHHLSWKTRKENEADKLDHGTHQHGERNIHAKLTWDDVSEIRRLRKSGVPLKPLAERFGVTIAAISNISTGIRWNANIKGASNGR